MGLYNPRDSGDSNEGSGIPGVEKVVFYQRPSFGLKIWGPFVPASDNLTALYSLTALQTLIGITMFRTVRMRWRDTSFWGRVTKGANAIGGSYVLFNSGLEVSRLLLPYDPWYDEAKRARESAIAQGKKPNWWFGPLDQKPMSLAEWNEKMDVWILDQEENLDRQSTALVGSPEIKMGYNHIKEQNTRRQSEILEQLQHNTFERNRPLHQSKVALRELHNPKHQVVIPEEYQSEENSDFYEIWDLNDPWNVLANDANILVRFIPASVDIKADDVVQESTTS